MMSTVLNPGDPTDCVIFGEALQAARDADVLIVLGSSLTYQPLVSIVEACQGEVILVG